MSSIVNTIQSTHKLTSLMYLGGSFGFHIISGVVDIDSIEI